MDYMEINIGTDKDPKLIKIGKGTSKEERNNLINLIKEYRYVLSFSYDEIKSYQEYVFQHTIPLTEEATKVKPFRQKLKQINPKFSPLCRRNFRRCWQQGL